MRLYRIDFEILDALNEHGRNVSINLQHYTTKESSYLNQRLPELQDAGLVRKIGPSNYSGLYEIAEFGKAVLDHQDAHLGSQDLDAFLDDIPISRDDFALEE